MDTRSTRISPDKTRFSLSINKALYEKVQKEAAHRHISANTLIVEAIESYLPNVESYNASPVYQEEFQALKARVDALERIVLEGQQKS